MESFLDLLTRFVHPVVPPYDMKSIFDLFIHLWRHLFFRFIYVGPPQVALTSMDVDNIVATFVFPVLDPVRPDSAAGQSGVVKSARTSPHITHCHICPAIVTTGTIGAGASARVANRCHFGTTYTEEREYRRGRGRVRGSALSHRMKCAAGWVLQTMRPLKHTLHGR